VFSFYRTFLTNKNSFIKDQHYVNNKNFFKLTEIFILLKTIVVPNENKRKKCIFLMHMGIGTYILQLMR